MEAEFWYIAIPDTAREMGTVVTLWASFHGLFAIFIRDGNIFYTPRPDKLEFEGFSPHPNIPKGDVILSAAKDLRIYGNICSKISA